MPTGPTIVFMSYARVDVQDERVFWMKETLERELKAHSGDAAWSVFLDTSDIKGGQTWRSVLKDHVNSSMFFCLLMSPSYFNSTNCRIEFEGFLAREKQLERDDLVFPLTWIALRSHQLQDALVSKASEHQRTDLSAVRTSAVGSQDSFNTLSRLAADIVEARDRGTPLSYQRLCQILDDIDLSGLESTASERGAIRLQSAPHQRGQRYEVIWYALQLVRPLSVERLQSALADPESIVRLVVDTFHRSGVTPYSDAEDLLTFGLSMHQGFEAALAFDWSSVYIPEVARILNGQRAGDLGKSR